MSDRKEFEDWFFSPSNSMSMSDIDVAWEAWQASATLSLQKNNPPVQVPMTREQAMAIVQSNPDTMTAIRMTEAHYGITTQCANITKKETP